ncbi:MAG: catalytic protein of component of various dehydrogenase complexe [Firmicutes bacterium]|nr:catalytic protein of component of various dehydrogenase complexe [Bacillota bacterium]
MPNEFRLPPAVAEPDAEGFIVNWFKAEGQAVRAGELLLEVQFDKVSTEVYADADGVVQAILVPQGEMVKVGVPLCLIGDAGDAGPAGTGTAPAAPKETPAPPEQPTREVRATPAARRIARELGVDIAGVRGSGPEGRITEDDVRGAAASGRRMPLSPAQKATGARMLASLRETAQLTLGREVDVTALTALREALKQSGSPVSLSDLLHRAVVLALQELPRMQGVLDNDAVVLPEGINLGFAVARGDDLLVPVIRQADQLDLAALAAERQRLTAAVRAGRPVDYVGATFTVTNLGVQGVDFFTPVLNPPQPAILGVGRVLERAAFVRGEVRPVKVITLSLTVDHRLINGAPAAAFLGRIADRLSSPTGWVNRA